MSKSSNQFSIDLNHQNQALDGPDSDLLAKSWIFCLSGTIEHLLAPMYTILGRVGSACDFLLDFIGLKSFHEQILKKPTTKKKSWKFWNSETYFFGIKKKAAFRYAARKYPKKDVLKSRIFSQIPGPDIRTGVPGSLSAGRLGILIFPEPEPQRRPLNATFNGDQRTGHDGRHRCGFTAASDTVPLKVAVEGRLWRSPLKVTVEPRIIIPVCEPNSGGAATWSDPGVQFGCGGNFLIYLSPHPDWTVGVAGVGRGAKQHALILILWKVPGPQLEPVHWQRRTSPLRLCRSGDGRSWAPIAPPVCSALAQVPFP